MIPTEISESIFPELAQTTGDAAILHHDCGVTFQFYVEPLDGPRVVITEDHLKTWRAKIDAVAAVAGENCFSYNDLESNPEGVYHHDDGNTMAILFSPGTFLEHNEVDGTPLLLLISTSECILTGSNSSEGLQMMDEYLSDSIATSVLTIDKKWENWVRQTIA